MNKRYEILRCGDQHGWAYAHIAKEHSRYSSHNISYAKHDEVDLTNKDIIYIHSPDIANYQALKLPLEAKSLDIKVIGGYAGNPIYWSEYVNNMYSFADLIVTISPQTYSFAKHYYKDIPVIFLPECVDTNFFTQNEVRDSLVIGWAGGRHKKIKRFYLTEKLKYTVTYKDDWEKQRYAKQEQHPLEEMREYYKNIDVLLVTSLSECLPRTVIEAMSMGKVVISTNVGAIKMLLPKSCIVSTLSDEKVIQEINEKLDWLKNNPQIRKEIGQRNREHVCKYFSWESQKELWDNMFSDLYNNKIGNIIERSENFLENFKEEFNSELVASDKLPKATVIDIPLIEKTYTTFDRNFQNVIKRLTQECNFSFWIADQSCKEAILLHKVKNEQDYISIGVANEEQRITIMQLIECINISKISFKVVINKDVTNLKNEILNGAEVKVPVPVVKYLKNLYGQKWDNV